MSASVCCKSSRALSTLMPGSVVGMYKQVAFFQRRHELAAQLTERPSGRREQEHHTRHHEQRVRHGEREGRTVSSLQEAAQRVLLLGVNALGQEHDGGEDHPAEHQRHSVGRQVRQRYQREQQRRSENPAHVSQEATPRGDALGDRALRDEIHHQDRDDRHGQQRAEAHGESLGEGKRLEQPSRLLAEHEDRQERDGDDEQAEEQRGADLGSRLGDDVDAWPRSSAFRDPLRARGRGACARSPP